MKKLIFLELILLFLATTFQSHNPPGWYQQTLPVNDFVNDIFFLDSLNGWVVTNGNFTQNDTGYIQTTTNGGADWTIQYDTIEKLNVIQFVDYNIGYVGGGFGRARLLKTTNRGINWQFTTPFGSNMYSILDLQFINQDSGWICSDDDIGGGIFKTTNGGGNWVRQLNETYRPTKLFFINKDTGWASCNMDKLYRTTNGGVNWNLQFISEFHIESLFFLNPFNGWMRGGYVKNTMGIAYTTDGGFTWINAHGEVGGFDIMFVSDSVGYSGSGPNKITKSLNGGKNWGRQISPIANNLSVSVLKGDSILAWAGGDGIVHTADGGGLIININKTGLELPLRNKLNQNYPNPFNPETIINYELSIPGYVKLHVYNLQGKEIAELVNRRQNTGKYEVDIDGSKLSSGVYYYKIEILDERSNNIFTDTKKMVLIR